MTVIRSAVLIKRITSHVYVRMWCRMYSVWDHQMFNVCEWVREREVFCILYRGMITSLSQSENPWLHLLCDYDESITESRSFVIEWRLWKDIYSQTHPDSLSNPSLPNFLLHVPTHSLSPADSFACKGLSRIERDYTSFFQEDFSVLCYGIPFTLFLCLYHHIWVS